LRIARGFGECRGLATPELEDIYQDTVEVLLKRRYASELHLRNALRAGLKHRSLHFHEREGRRAEIRSESTPTLQAPELERQDDTERAALIRQDRLVVTEFLAELTPIEQRVFWLLAEGMKYRQIAKVLNLEGKDAHKAERSCEKKRGQFQVLYEAGRLCGYRAATIQALQAGQATSEELAGRAFAHLESCASCRAEHRTNARRLRLRFQGQAKILLPVPTFLHRLGWLARLDVKARVLLHRIAADGMPLGTGGVRERGAALLAGGGAAAKAAMTVATVAVIAGGTIATKALDHKPTQHHHHATTRVAAGEPSHPVAAEPAATPPVLRATSQPQRKQARVQHRQASSPAHRRTPTTMTATSASGTGTRREPGGFAYLGVPHESSSTSPQTPAHAASSKAGGQFSP
jgi:RNA polymerase sigma factor (sigma-70 family)